MSSDKALKQIAAAINDLKVDLISIHNEIVTVKTELKAVGNRLTVVETAQTNNTGNQAPTNPPNNNIILDSTTTLPIPFYDSKSMSPDYFIKEVMDYFTWKQIPNANWHLLVGRFFDRDSDTSRWWAATKSQVTKWDEFSMQFKKYEKLDSNQDILAQSLFSKTQSFNEAFETFCWETATLFRKIDAGATDAAVVERILNSCIPELSISLRIGSYKTVSELICQGRVVISHINKSRIQGNKIPLRARSTDPIVKPTENHNFKNKLFFNKSKFRNNNDSKQNYFQKQNSSFNSRNSYDNNSNNPHASYLSHDKHMMNKNANELSNEHCKYCKGNDHSIETCAKLKAKEHAKKSQKPAAQGN